MATPTLSFDKDAYSALLSGSALLDREDAGLIILRDADRADFLQRMTTANVAALRPGQAALAVLTSPVARIEFVFTVLCQADELWLLPAPSQAEGLAAKLRSQIFFMDKVKVVNASQQFRRWRLIDAEAATILAKVGLAKPAADDTFVNLDGVTILHQDRYEVPGWELLVPIGDATEESIANANHLRDRLIAAGATLLTDAEAYENRRIELGRPRVGAELTGEYNPLEAGLAWSVADNKGCYTGQEIIARQITYDKVTKSLVGLRSDVPLPVGSDVTTAEGRSVGQVTSSGFSPSLGSPLALAVIKRPFNAAHTELLALDHPVRVVDLPVVDR